MTPTRAPAAIGDVLVRLEGGLRQIIADGHRFGTISGGIQQRLQVLLDEAEHARRPVTHCAEAECPYHGKPRVSSCLCSREAS